MAFTDGAIFRGDTVQFSDTVTQADGVTPYNLTGASVSFIGALDPGRAVTVFNKSIGADVTVPTPANGVINLWIRPADTSGLAPWALLYCYAIVTDSGGNVYTTKKFTVRLAV
jgi:hypothetical protein